MAAFDIKDGTLVKYNGSATAVCLPEEVTAIGPRAFYGNTRLSKISYKTPLAAIGREAFSGCTALRTVELTGVFRVGREAFRDCVALESVTVTASAGKIAEDAFLGCTALREIRVDEAHPSLSSLDGVLYTKGGLVLLVYPAGREDTAFTAPARVTEIGDGAFCGARALTTVHLPDGLISVGDAAFSGCTALRTVYLPAGAAVAANAFAGCPRLAAPPADPDLTVRGGVLCDYTGTAAELALPEGITAIDLDAFAAAPAVNRLTLPASLSEIEEGALSPLSALDEIAVAEGNTHFAGAGRDLCEMLLSADGETLYRVRAHYHGTLSVTARRVADGAAYGLCEFVALSLGAGVREIGDFAFAGCEMLERIEIAPDHGGELLVGEGAFHSCPRLSRIACPAALADTFRTACPGATVTVVG